MATRRLKGTTEMFTLTIYDMEGRLKYTRKQMFAQPGRNEFYWNGQSSAGNSLPPGVYIIVVSDFNGNKLRKKIVKISDY